MITSLRVSRCVHGLALGATTVAFVAVALVFKSVDPGNLANAAKYCLAVPAFALISIAVAACCVTIRTDKHAWELIVCAIVDAMLLAATLAAMQAP